MMGEQQTLELKVGRTYRGKKPGPVRDGIGALVNDRTVTFLTIERVQYDGPAVAHGRRYPTVEIRDFLKWAERDVTDELPPNEYAKWPPAKKGT